MKDLGNDDYPLAVITTNSYKSVYSLPVHTDDFAAGSLPATRPVRCNRLFEVNGRMGIKKVAAVKPAVTQKLIALLIDFLKEP